MAPDTDPCSKQPKFCDWRNLTDLLVHFPDYISKDLTGGEVAPDGNVETVWPIVLHRTPPLNDHAWFGLAGADDHPAMEGPVPVAVPVDELSRFRLASLSPGTVKYVEQFFG